jgi:tetratricopeptide (TPR) repeat protein
MGVVHRDLHPWNVMIHNGEPVIIDWGLAWHAEEADEASGQDLLQELAAASELVREAPGFSGFRLSELPDSPKTTAAIGMVAYRSPEQGLGPWNRPADARSDVFSLGSILHTIATGRIPGESADKVEPRIAAPRPLAAIVARATCDRIEGRYPTVDALANDLERFLAGDVVEADREPWTEKAIRWIGHHRTLAASSAAVLMVSMVLVSGASWLLFRSRVRELELEATVFWSRLRELELEATAQSHAERAEILDRNTGHLARAMRNLLTATDVMGLERRGFRGSDSARDFRRSLDDISQLTTTVIEDSKAAEMVSSEARAELIDSLGNAYRSIGEMRIARPLIMKGIRLREGATSPDPAMLSQSYFHLGLLEHFSGNYEQAERAYAEAVQLEKSGPVPLDLELAKIQFHRAWLLAEREQNRESVQLFDEVIALRTRSLGPNAQDVRYAKLARLIALTQRGDPAELVKETALLALTGDPLPRLLLDYYRAKQAREKADQTRKVEDVALAREKLNQVLASLGDKVPPRHPSIALLLGDIASFEWDHDNYDRAWTLITEAVEIGIEVAPAHPRLLAVMDRIAVDSTKANREAEAEALFKKVFEALNAIEPESVRDRARRTLRASLAKLPKYRRDPGLMEALW